ncbi:IS3 family transposase [Corynebacterium intestinale]|uniref:IS3 family transposase n=1 Tax=Corynebacterium intestinale TaxID=2943492 RepID=UPI0034627558
MSIVIVSRSSSFVRRCESIVRAVLSPRAGIANQELVDPAPAGFVMLFLQNTFADNYGVYGIRKMWHALRREGIDIGREHTARLMRLAGVSGKG